MEHSRKLALLTEEPNFIDDICAHISSGGSLIDYARTLDVKYASIMAWVHRSPERQEAYKLAIDARAEWAMERVLGEIHQLGFVDIRRAYDSDGELLKISEMPESIARAVQSYEVDNEGNEKIKLYDKLKALEMIGKNFGMFIERHEVDLSKQTLEALISGSMPEAAPRAIPPPEAQIIETEAVK